MALQWMILTYVVAVEAAIAVLLTIPSPKLVKSRIVSLVSLILQPSMFVVPFSAFQLLGLSLSFFLFIPPYLHLYGLLNWGPLNSFQDFGFLIRLYISSLSFFFFSIDIYWKNEHRLMCTGESCTAAERDRYEKSVSCFISCVFLIS